MADSRRGEVLCTKNCTDFLLEVGVDFKIEGRQEFSHI